MTKNMSSWWGEDAGLCIVLVEDVGILLAGVDTRPVVTAVSVGVAFAGPLSGSRPFGNEPFHWGPCCLIPF